MPPSRRTAQARDRPRLQRGGDGRPRGPRHRPRGARTSTCSSSTTARPTRPRPRPPREGAAVITPPLQPRDRRRGAVRLQVRAAPRLRRRGPGRRRRPAQARVPAARWSTALHTSGGRPTWSTAAASCGDPGYKVPLGRRLGNLIFSVVLTHAHPPADHRPDLRLPDDQPARDRALRPRLPARLPRGRGAADAARQPPAHPRGSRADERARLRRRARSTTRAAPTTWSR